MTKKSFFKKNLIVVIIVVIIGILLYSQGSFTRGTQIKTPVVGGRGYLNPEPTLTVQYYDSNRNEIIQSAIGTMALVDNMPTQAQYISLKILVSNTGNVKISVKPKIATPVAFNAAIQNIQPVELEPGESYTFTSDLIDVDIILNAP